MGQLYAAADACSGVWDAASLFVVVLAVLEGERSVVLLVPFIMTMPELAASSSTEELAGASVGFATVAPAGVTAAVPLSVATAGMPVMMPSLLVMVV